MFLGFIIIIFFLIIIIIILKNKNRLLMNKIYKCEEIINKQGMNNHEYNNQLMVLSGYLDCKNIDKMKDYLKTIIKDHRTGEDYDTKQLSKLPKGGLKELLYYKIAKMDELCIEYYLDIDETFIKNIEKTSVNNYSDMTKIFGVLIDNSIDASRDTKGEVEINLSTKEDYLIIIIKNQVNKINMNKLGKNRYTTKGIGHGFGLQVVNRIIKNNKSLDVSYDLEDNQLIQTIIIDIK